MSVILRFLAAVAMAFATGYGIASGKPSVWAAVSAVAFTISGACAAIEQGGER